MLVKGVLMMPRISLRRVIVYISAVAACSIVMISFQQPVTWFAISAPRAPNPTSHEVLLPPQALHLLENDSARRLPPSVTSEPEHHDKPLNETTPAITLPPYTPPKPEDLPWYFKNGLRRPSKPQMPLENQNASKLWPDETGGDRITEQLMYRPILPSDNQAEDDQDVSQYKTILINNGLNSMNLRAGRGAFLKHKCPVDTCILTGSRSDASRADAILFKDHFSVPSHPRPSSQVWIMYMLECPYHTQQFHGRNLFNWTATYRWDSDIVAPYEKWTYYDPNVRQKLQDFNYAANKTKKVAWFVSNCGARNNRLQYARELAKYIDVDIYGACGTKRCPRSSASKCFDLLNKEYKFYLAFENSNCRDYITEKFFVNGLKGRGEGESHNILPIAMGAHPDDYRKAAPEKSFIHVDDFESPRHLAQYLHLLDTNDHLYNEYFRWKGTGEFINTFFMCRLCALLHDDNHSQHYQDLNKWWRNSQTCTTSSWTNKDPPSQKQKDTPSQDLTREQMEEAIRKLIVS